MNDNSSIFISYASPDQTIVKQIADDLESLGIPVWMDCKNLLPGNNWNLAIKKAQSQADLVLIFISKNSVSRRGYVQRELKEALDAMKERITDDIYIIPIRLDHDIPIPNEISHLHVVNYEGSKTTLLLEKTINLQIERLGKEISNKQSEIGVSWSERKYNESWDGAPGYEFEYNWLDFASEKYVRIEEATQIVRGALVSEASMYRECKTEKQNEYVNFADDEFQRISTWQAFCGDPVFVSKIMSLVYAVHWFGAGAAHPNYRFQTFNFILEPFIVISSLQSIFENPEDALLELKKKIRELLLADFAKLHFERESDVEGYVYEPNDNWINAGTESWEDLSSFSFAQDGIRIYFAPYQVGSYAEGSFEVVVSYETIVKLLKPFYISALNLRYRNW